MDWWSLFVIVSLTIDIIIFSLFLLKVTSPKSNKSSRTSLSSDYCHDAKAASCCPWRMPRPNIPAAMRSFQMKLRASTSVTSQSHQPDTSRSLFSLFKKRHSTPVVPFNGTQDLGVTCVQELRGSKSVGAVTDHFARVEVGAQKGKTRSIPSRGTLRQQGIEQGSIKSVFSLPGAVIDDDVELNACAIGNGTQRASFYSEIDTNKADLGSITSNEAKPSHVHDEKTFTGQAGPTHEVDILFINHSDEELKPDVFQQDVLEETQEVIMVEKFTASPSTSDDDIPVDTTKDAIICEPVCSMDNEIEDTTGKPDMDIVVSICGDVTQPEEQEKLGHTVTSRDEKISYADQDNLEEEVRFFDKNSEEGDDYVKLDDLLGSCPKSEVIMNLQSAMELSKCATRQLEKALKKWSRISRGPFPRQPGKCKTKEEIIDDKTVGLRSETSRYLDEMNKVYFNFYSVTERMDHIEERQEHLVDYIKAKMHAPSTPVGPKPAKLPKWRKDLADLYVDNRAGGRSESHKVKALLGSKIPPTISEEEEEEV